MQKSHGNMTSEAIGTCHNHTIVHLA